MSNESVADGDVRRKGGLGQRIAYACGNLGQAAFYNAMSTYFVTYVTSCLFVSYSKALAAQMIAVITGLIVVIRIAEIFIDPLLGNLVDNTTTKWGRFRPWQFIGGLVSSVLIVLIFSGMFGLVNVNTTLFIVLFIITFIVLDVFYSLRDISYWGMIPALSSDSHERSTYTALGTFTGSIGYNGITVIVIPIVSYFTWTFTGAKGQGQAGWTSFGFIVALLGLITAWTVAFGTKESTSALRAKAQKNGNPFEAFKALFQNDQLLWVALSYLLYAIANVITTGVMYYLFVFVLDEPAAFSITGIIPLIAGFIMAPLYPILNRWIPRRYLFTGGMVPAYIMVVNVLHLGNTYWALWLPTAMSAFNMIIIKNYFQGIPMELEEAAIIDGSNDLITFVRIILPLSAPVLASVSLFYAVSHWNSYFQAMLYINNSDMEVITIVLRRLVFLTTQVAEDSTFDWGAAGMPPIKAVKMATTVLSPLPILCIYPFVQKFFTQGVMVGSVKG